MSRDLFADTLATRRAPRRSRWTILGSALAHAGLVTALLVIPVLSALDNFVLHADDSLTFVIPAVNLPSPPPPPPPPPRTMDTAAATQIDTTAAPAEPPDHAVTIDVTPLPGGGGSTAFGAINIGSGASVLSQGTGAVVLDAPPRPVVPVRPGGDLKAPARLIYVPPSYPPLAKATHVDGSVILEATIDETGAVRDVRVLRSIPLLDRAAVEAVSQWRYTPTKLNGAAVPILLTVTVTFSIK